MRKAERVEVFLRSRRHVRIEHGWGEAGDPSGRYQPDWTLDVGFQGSSPADPGPIRKVELTMPGGITPTGVQRFGWSRWLPVADGFIRNPGRLPQLWRGPGEAPSDEEQRKWEARRGEAERRIREQTKIAARPGVSGHPDDFYRAVADLYLHYTATGDRAPTLRMAGQFGRPRNTVARWVRRARQLGYLPPARWGKAR